VRAALLPPASYDPQAAASGSTSTWSVRLLQPLSASGSSSRGGIYYVLSCSASGLWTDPATGACANASHPASYRCAFGAGAACTDCPAGAMCPGGYRLWPRPGYWAATEGATSVLPCPPPDPTARCPGWGAEGPGGAAAACGPGYLAGSFLCQACAPRYYPSDVGDCAACPVISGAWDRYRGLLGLLAGIAAFVGVVAAALYVTLLCCVRGGSLAGGARQLVGLGIWTLTTLQVVSQVSRVSSPSLPPLLAGLYRGVAVLQFAGIVLPPACTGA
jgi:hypothetical protein